MSDRKIEQGCADVSFPQLSVYDLMLYYFPDRKGTISRIRKLDEKQRLEAYEKRLLRKEQQKRGYVYAGGDDENLFLSRMVVRIPAHWSGLSTDELDRKVNALRLHVSDIGEIEVIERGKAETTFGVGESWIFSWFPFTTVQSHLNVCSEFVVKLIRELERKTAEEIVTEVRQTNIQIAKTV